MRPALVFLVVRWRASELTLCSSMIQGGGKRRMGVMIAFRFAPKATLSHPEVARRYGPEVKFGRSHTKSPWLNDQGCDPTDCAMPLAARHDLHHRRA